MMRLVAPFLLASVLAATAPLSADTAQTPAPLDAQSNVLFKRMVALNGALHTYKATVHLDVALKSFPFISPSLDGTAYYKKPDKEAVVFDTVPALASQFKKVYPKIDRRATGTRYTPFTSSPTSRAVPRFVWYQRKTVASITST